MSNHVFAERGFEVRASLRCGVDAYSLVLAFVVDAGAAGGAVPCIFASYDMRLTAHIHRDVVEDDGLLADGRAVESVPAKARLVEAERVHDFVVVDWLLLQTVCGRLEDDEHQLVVLETLHDGTHEKVRARELANSMAREACKVSVLGFSKVT